MGFGGPHSCAEVKTAFKQEAYHVSRVYVRESTLAYGSCMMQLINQLQKSGHSNTTLCLALREALPDLLKVESDSAPVHASCAVHGAHMITVMHV